MLNIRGATLEDLEDIKNLNSLVMFENPSFDSDIVEDFAHSTAGDKYFKEAIEDKEGIFLVAEEDGKLVGYINGRKTDFMYRKSRYFEIENLGVIPQTKRKGFGSKLMEDFTKIAKDRGFQKIYLNCYAKNQEALEFYKHKGYIEIDTCLEKNI